MMSRVSSLVRECSGISISRDWSLGYLRTIAGGCGLGSGFRVEVEGYFGVMGLRPDVQGRVGSAHQSVSFPRSRVGM